MPTSAIFTTNCSTKRYAWGPSVVFFFNDTATTEIYTLSLHDAHPDLEAAAGQDQRRPPPVRGDRVRRRDRPGRDRKSTRLNSSHMSISYAVFCLKKKKMSASSSSARKKQAKRSQR